MILAEIGRNFFRGILVAGKDKVNWLKCLFVLIVAALLVFFSSVLFIKFPVTDAGHLASWAQAVGAFVAILMSAGLVRYQMDEALHEKERTAADRGLAFITNLEGLRSDLESLKKLNKNSLRIRHAILNEWVLDARSIPLENLSIEWVVGLNLIRGSAVQLLENFRQEIDAKRKSDMIDISDPIFRDLKNGIDVFYMDFSGVAEELRNRSFKPDIYQRNGPAPRLPQESAVAG